MSAEVSIMSVYARLTEAGSTRRAPLDDVFKLRVRSDGRTRGAWQRPQYGKAIGGAAKTKLNPERLGYATILFTTFPSPGGIVLPPLFYLFDLGAKPNCRSFGLYTTILIAAQPTTAMPKAKAAAAASLAGMIDSEDEQTNADIAPKEDSNQENQEPTPTAKGRGKAKAGRKTKPASKRLSTGKAKTTTARKTTRKAPLKSKVNDEDVDEGREADVIDATPQAMAVEEPVTARKVEEKPAAKRKGRPPKKAAEPPKDDEPAPAAVATLMKDGEFEYTSTTVRQATKRKAPARGKKAAVANKPKEPSAEPSLEPAEIDLGRSVEQVDEDDDDVLSSLAATDDLEAPSSILSALHRPSSRARSTSHQAPSISAQPNPRKRQLSVSSSNAADDPSSAPALRCKLGDLTNRYASLETRYRTLDKIGVKDAETNFKDLQKASEDRDRASQSLINGLKKELAAERDFAEEAREKLEELDVTNQAVAELQNRLEEATTALGDVQAENKALQARLVASRTAAANVEAMSGVGGKAPGSAVKGHGGKTQTGGTSGGNGTTTKTIMVGSAEAAAAAQVAMLKEELYGDLTGLIIRGVERGEEAHVYDCIQTGRNGSKSPFCLPCHSPSFFVFSLHPPRIQSPLAFPSLRLSILFISSTR